MRHLVEKSVCHNAHQLSWLPNQNRKSGQGNLGEDYMKLKALLLFGICAGTIATLALAQDAQADEDAFQSAGPVIVVTAQRQAQSLQEVPIAVSAFDAEALESQQIENASDLQLTLPNVSFTKSNFTASEFYHPWYR
jgi:outer membrane receptor protein involved in Fe transport